ncbi:hypothetical protein F5Y13DRAFT_204858 [Hypoxylon sp. FL1857]|nr:hypothetical protein F5Y13DRAFT_204858 [Hypoxylon sp. FL1857]
MAPYYHHVQGWPEGPQRPRNKGSRPTEMLYNCTLLLLTLSFIVFEILIAHSEGLPSNSDLVQKLDRASRFAPTVFPVIYALVVGGAIRSLALWRLQTGERVHLLDLLLGSTSVGSAIGTQLERKFTQIDLTSISLLVLWSLSPLGGQASLRVTNYQDFPIIERLNLSYVDFSNASFPYGMGYGDIAPHFDNINSAFLSSLSTPLSVRESPMDPWGNIKIPVLESFPGYTDQIEWVPISGYSETTPYSSLIGVPVANIPRTGVTEFSLETAYWNIRCPKYRPAHTSKDEPWWEEVDVPISNSGDVELICNKTISDKSNVDGVVTRRTVLLVRTRESDVVRRCHDKNTEDIPSRQLFFQSQNSSRTYSEMRASCTLKTTYIEALVKCHGWDCGVEQLRRSRRPQRHRSNYTVLDYCPDYNNVGTNAITSTGIFLKNFLDATGRYSTSTVGLLDGYIFSPNRPFSDLVSSKLYYDLSAVGNESFSLRLSQLLNTYFSAYYNYNLTFESHPQSLAYDKRYYFDLNPITEVIGTNTRLETRFVFSRGWMAVLVLSTSVMFTSGIVKLVYDLKIWIPDLLMNVSTLLRGSMSHCPNLPFGGTTLDDSDRSRLLKDRMVRFGNIRAEDGSAGELWIGELAEDEGHVTEVARDKTYW